jgi:hypothetical protein
MFAVRAAKDWLLLIEQHKKTCLPAFLGGILLYLCVAMLWPKQYLGSALVELNPSINWQPDISNQHLTATAAIRRASSRADWAAIVERLHLYPQTVADGRLADAADYLASQVSIKQIEDPAHGGLIVRIDYTDPNRNLALGVTQAVVENLVKPMLLVGDGSGEPLPALSNRQIAPPTLKTSTRQQRRSAHPSNAARHTAPDKAELTQQLQARAAEGSSLQDALGRNTLELNGLRDQLQREEEQMAATAAEPAPQRKSAAPKVDPRVEHLRGELARAQQALLELQQRYTDDYPDVVAARERVQDLQLDLSRIAALDPSPAPSPAKEEAAPPQPAASSKANTDAAHAETLRRLSGSQATQDKLRQDIDRNRAAVTRLQSELAERNATDSPSASAANPPDLSTTAQAGAAQSGAAEPAGDSSQLSPSTPGESTAMATSFTNSLSVPLSAPLSAPLALAQSPTVAASPRLFAGWILWILSVALGTLAALVAAWLAELRDPSIRTERVLRRELPSSAEYLGGIPRVRHEAIQ